MARLGPGVLRGVGIDALAEQVPVGDASWTGRSRHVTVSEGAAETDRIDLPAFPIIGDDEDVAAYRLGRQPADRYRVRRLSLMSIPDCALVGPDLVAVRDGEFVQETAHGRGSFRDRAAFAVDDDGVRLSPDARRVRFDEAVIALGGTGTQGYFHWMTQIVPRLLHVRERLAQNDLPVLVRPAEKDFQRRSFELLGLRARFVEEEIVEVARAVIPSFPLHPRRGGRYGPELVTLAHRFRDLVAGEHGEDLPKRIYVSRRDAARRRVVEEEAVEKRLSALGFSCLTLSERPLEEQVALFAGADIVVAQHGAGLTNTLFCRPGARVLELYPRGLAAPSPFWSFAGLAGLDYRMVICEPAQAVDPARVINANIRVDLDQLTDALSAG